MSQRAEANFLTLRSLGHKSKVGRSRWGPRSPRGDRLAVKSGRVPRKATHQVSFLRNHIVLIPRVWIPCTIWVVEAIWRILVAVPAIRVCNGVCIVWIGAESPPVVSLLVKDFRGISRVRIVPRLITIGAPVLAIRIVQPVGSVWTSRAVGIVEAVIVIRANGDSRCHREEQEA